MFRWALSGHAVAACLFAAAICPRAHADEARPSEPQAEREPTGFGLVPFAAVAYQDETSLLFGAAAIGFYHHRAEEARRDPQVLLAGAASVRKQFSAILTPDVYVANDNVHIGGTVSVARFPDQFFGIESGRQVADPEFYTPVYAEASISPKIRIHPTEYAYLGPDIRVLHTDIVEKAPRGLLDTAQAPGVDGGLVAQAGLRGFWDTRDSTLYPRRGSLVELSWLGANRALGSDYGFSRARIDGRHYFGGFGRQHVLALQEVVEFRSGSAPFYELGKLGGDRLIRGHFEGKHRDRQLAAVQLEYRFPIVWRFGAVVFGGGGVVAPTLATLFTNTLYGAAGGGVRFAPSAKAPVNIRLDIAYGDDVRFYLNVGEAF